MIKILYKKTHIFGLNSHIQEPWYLLFNADFYNYYFVKYRQIALLSNLSPFKIIYLDNKITSL